MNNVSKSIGWATHTLNPFSGCSEVSAGCQRCYAAAIARRFKKPWGKPVFYPERLLELKTHKPRRIFMCSASDLFHEQNSAENIAEVLDAMYQNPQHTYLLLTKRPQNIRPWRLHPTWWIGVSTENQQMYDLRTPHLAKVRGHKFISVEPMLAPVKITDIGLEWVICGPENGPGKRPCDGGWITDLFADCDKLKIPFFDKREYGFKMLPKGVVYKSENIVYYSEKNVDN